MPGTTDTNISVSVKHISLCEWHFRYQYISICQLYQSVWLALQIPIYQYLSIISVCMTGTKYSNISVSVKHISVYDWHSRYQYISICQLYQSVWKCGLKKYHWKSKSRDGHSSQKLLLKLEPIYRWNFGYLQNKSNMLGNNIGIAPIEFWIIFMNENSL